MVELESDWRLRVWYRLVVEFVHGHESAGVCVKIYQTISSWFTSELVPHLH